MKSILRLNAKAFPIIGVIAFIMQIVDPSRVWVVLLIGIGGLWLFCRWWVRGLARSLQFKREMRYGWAQVGDRLEERFTLTNQFTLPATWVAVHDNSTLPDHRTSVATGVDGKSTSQWKILNQCTRRGVFTLGGTTLETGDPFGVYTLKLEDPTTTTLAVMPPIVSLPPLMSKTSSLLGNLMVLMGAGLAVCANANPVQTISATKHNAPMRAFFSLFTSLSFEKH